jgi:hypothetical protein
MLLTKRNSSHKGKCFRRVLVYTLTQKGRKDSILSLFFHSFFQTKMQPATALPNGLTQYQKAQFGKKDQASAGSS